MSRRQRAKELGGVIILGNTPCDETLRESDTLVQYRWFLDFFLEKQI